MYRVLKGNGEKVADATYKAGSAMKRGMLVVKGTTGEVDFPAAATDKNVFFVGGEFIATGVNGDRDLPDYNAEFEDIADGDAVVVEKPVAGEEYFTDQFTTGVAVGKYVNVGTDGKLVSTGTTATKMIVRATDYADCGSHTGIVVEILD